MPTLDEKIAALEAKLKQERARKQKIDARQRHLISQQTRADDTRRKILVGALILGKVDQGQWPREKLMAMLNQSLVRLQDRALFDLDAPTAPSTPTPPEPTS